MRAVELKLLDGREVVVREPYASESPGVMRSIMPLLKLSEGGKIEDPLRAVELVMADEKMSETLMGLVSLLSGLPVEGDEGLGHLGMSEYQVLLATAIQMSVPEGGSPLAPKKS